MSRAGEAGELAKGESGVTAMTVEQELQQAEPVEAGDEFQFHTPEPLAFAEYIRERRGARKKSDLPPYAVPVDDDVRRTLSLVPFGHRIDDYLEKMIQYQIGPVLHNAVRVSPRQFPELYRIIDRCANRLGIAVPRLMVVPDVRMNAVTMGTDENHFIMITSASVEKCSEEELTFLIGHECGHIHCRHLSYLALARLLVETTANLTQFAPAGLLQPLKMMLQVPMAAWQRKAELTCDRAGLICSRSLAPSLRALVKQVVQGSQLANSVDMDEYLRELDQAHEESTISKLPEYLAAVPFVPKRMRALQLFARSELYFELTDQEKPEDALPREELEKQADRVTSIL